MYHSKISKIPGTKSNETEISDYKFSKISVYLTRLSLFQEIQEKNVPFPFPHPHWKVLDE